LRDADLLLVLDVPTAGPWTSSNVRLLIPNDREMWSPWS
jgi:hypothetical protein